LGLGLVEEPDQPHGCKIHSKARDSKARCGNS
jgi:hypothetical protein